MLKDIIDKEFYDQLKNGARRILNEDYVRVLAHYDGDGTSSAIILTNALKRKDIKFHLGYIKALDGESFRKRIEEDDITTIVVDAGSDQVQYVPEYEKIIVLDHHFFNRTTIKGININARDYNVDGTREACGATMAFLMALAMDEANADLLPFFVAGAIADKQDMGGFHGLNRKLVEAYGSKSHVFRGINLEGGNLIDSITYSTDPFFNELTGKPENVEKFLSAINVPGNLTLQELGEDQIRKLAVNLSLKLLEQGVGTEALKYLENDIMSFDGMEFSSKELSNIIDGNGKVGWNSIPVQFFLGDKTVREEMVKNWKVFKTKLIDYVYRSNKELFEESHLRYFYAPESEMAGAISGALMLYLAKQNKPLIGFNVGNGDTKVSSRGTRRMVKHGLNLSLVMKEAGKEVGGSGGGHDIAAGAVIPRGKEKQFLEIANNIVAGQIKILN